MISLKLWQTRWMIAKGRAALGDAAHEVRAGGAVLFEADRPHTYRNRHKRTIEMVMVVVQPPDVERGAVSHPG